ncbi:MAG: hypothetical protein KDA52_24700, partial [Planctomycetaceae bacterium]|nr:hypothetical protein [Planctomycetaceae bacterium]
ISGSSARPRQARTRPSVSDISRSEMTTLCIRLRFGWHALTPQAGEHVSGHVHTHGDPAHAVTLCHPQPQHDQHATAQGACSNAKCTVTVRCIPLRFMHPTSLGYARIHYYITGLNRCMQP